MASTASRLTGGAGLRAFLTFLADLLDIVNLPGARFQTLGVFLAFADAFWAFAEAFWARVAALSSLAAEWFLLWRATAFAISSEESLAWFSECRTSVCGSVLSAIGN
jgi:hypothetical protein